MVEWVPTKAYARWEPPSLDGLQVKKKGSSAEKAGGKPKPAKPPKGEYGRVKEGPAAIERRPPIRVEPKKELDSKPAPTPRDRQRASGAGPTPPSPLASVPQGERTVAQEEAGRQARADLVAAAMKDRDERKKKYGDRYYRDKDMSIWTGELVEPWSNTREIRAIHPGSWDSRTQEIPRLSGSTQALPVIDPNETTREIPLVGQGPSRALSGGSPLALESRRPRVDRSIPSNGPIPMGSTRREIREISSGRNQEQLSLFHVPGDIRAQNLTAAQAGRSQRQSLVPSSAPAGRQVSKLAARPTPGKKAGDQGVLLQPARYRSVT